jgi:hypothetical protein
MKVNLFIMIFVALLYSLTNNSWVTSTAGNYDMSYNMNFSYDANGNLATLTRNGAGTSIKAGSNLTMDNLSYGYYEGNVTSNLYQSNKLACLTDAVANTNYADDVDGFNNGQACNLQTNKRYEYDEIGNLYQLNLSFKPKIVITFFYFLLD